MIIEYINDDLTLCNIKCTCTSFYVNSAVLHTLGALNLSFNPIIMLLRHYTMIHRFLTYQCF